MIQDNRYEHEADTHENLRLTCEPCRRTFTTRAGYSNHVKDCNVSRKRAQSANTNQREALIRARKRSRHDAAQEQFGNEDVRICSIKARVMSLGFTLSMGQQKFSQ
jgi:hypothetical protein